MQNYLPAQQVSGGLPALLGVKGASGGKGFESEREILYQVLFDMRRDVTELKKLVHDIMAERAGGQRGHVDDAPVQYIQNPLSLVQEPSVVSVPSVNPAIAPVKKISKVTTPVPEEMPEVQDTEEYVEENLSLDEVEKEMIRKALERHHGKRKNAANDLKISERTLYRKIKEYGLD